MLRTPPVRSLVVTAVVVVGAIAIAGAVAAERGGSAERSLVACAKARSGELRLVRSARQCTSGDRAVSWATRGSVGPAGANGTPGIAGAAGTQGATGARGDQGDQGASGAPGVAGSQGPQGLPGAAGASGAQGAQGVQGTPGTQGPIGLTGSQGSPGPSTPGAGFASSDPGDIAVPTTLLEVGSLAVPSGSYIVNAKLDFFYTVADLDVGGQSEVTCYLMQDGGVADRASEMMERGKTIGLVYTWSAYTATISLAAGVSSGAPSTLGIVCSRGSGASGDGMVARDRKIVAVRVSSVTDG